MKLCISNIAWNPEEEERVARTLAGLGVGNVEVAPLRAVSAISPAAISEGRRYRKFWNDFGIEIYAMQALLFGRPDLVLFESHETRRALFEYLVGVVDLAKELGATRLVFGSPKNRLRNKLSSSEAEGIAAEFFEMLGEHARRNECIICIEANPPQYGCDFLTNWSELTSFLKSVKSAGIGAQLDLGALVINGENLDEVITVPPPHVHISAPNLETIYASDQLPISYLGKRLASVGYGGALSIEMKRSEGEAVDLVSRAVAAVRAEIAIS